MGPEEKAAGVTVVGMHHRPGWGSIWNL